MSVGTHYQKVGSQFAYTVQQGFGNWPVGGRYTLNGNAETVAGKDRCDIAARVFPVIIVADDRVNQQQRDFLG